MASGGQFSYLPGIVIIPILIGSVVVAVLLFLLRNRIAAHWNLALYYHPVALPSFQTVPDVCYTDADFDPKHRLNLYTPTLSGWPVLIFAHGGNWDSGDKNMRMAANADVYNNIGRFYAARGIWVAIVNYRLQPTVSWREQVADLAAATAWLYGNIAKRGGDPKRLFLCGHSAGAQLASHMAFDPVVLANIGLSSEIIAGVISVSGAGLDITDEKTYALGANRADYAKRFAGSDTSNDWQKVASPITYVGPHVPPCLVLYAKGEPKRFRRQSELLAAALAENNLPHRLFAVPGLNHTGIMLTLSNPGKPASDAVLNFIRDPAAATAAKR